MSATFCSRCATPIADPVCPCGEAKPVGGWPEDPLLSTWLENRYRIVRRLGAGGTSVVYFAQQYHPAGKVAIKITHPHLRDERWQRRLENEALILSQLRSPAAVRVFDHGRFRDHRYYMVMEYLEGQTLSEMLDDCGRLPAELAVDLVIQAAETLSEAHGLGIVHRDLKPSNLFRLPGGRQDRLKILDFGIAERRGIRTLNTTEYGLLGTPRYMAPEQILDPDSVDPRGDIFALGIVLYELVSGRLPYPWENTMQQLSRRVLEAPVPLEQLMPSPAFPPSLYAVVRRMIDHRVQRRYQSIDEVMGALLAVYEDLRDAVVELPAEALEPLALAS